MGQRVDQAALPVLAAQGLTRDKIAASLGVSSASVDRHLRILRLSTGRTGPRAGSAHPGWKGGRTVDKHGYILVWVPLHPQAGHTGYVREHRLVAEVLLGRYLKPEEVVDHLDDHPYHNWPLNLQLFPSNADHLAWTTSGRQKATQRSSIPGAYGSSQQLPHCPGANESLAQCPSETSYWLEHFVESHRPTSAHRNLPRRSFLRAGAHRPPFRPGSRG